MKGSTNNGKELISLCAVEGHIKVKFVRALVPVGDPVLKKALGLSM